jgi:uncharacterized membrane protein (DUF485 family)
MNRLKTVMKILLTIILWTLAWSFYKQFSTTGFDGEKSYYGWPSGILTVCVSIILTIAIWKNKEFSELFKDIQ